MALVFLPKKRCDLTQVVISGPTVSLRAACLSDAETIFEHFTPEITRYMIPAAPHTLQQSTDYLSALRRNMKKGKECVCVIHTPDIPFCGLVGLHSTEEACVLELGIWCAKSHQGQGYGRTAIAMMMAWACVHFKVLSFRYPVDKKNRPSRKIPERFGGHIVAEKRVQTMDSHRILDEVVYEIPLPSNNNK
jgi:RimJ/RimL family protein N-acetyltransferase